MKKVSVLFQYIILLFVILQQISCKKYLDEKPIKIAAIPNRLKDLQALLDNTVSMNTKTPECLELLSDNYYTLTARWQSSPLDERLNYIWDKDATSISTWSNTYQNPVYYANVVLDQLPLVKYTDSEKDEYDRIKASALFFRAFAFHQLAQLYCRPYSESAESDPGIVLRLTAAIEASSVRSTVKQTYNKIISDFKEALELLPETTKFPTRPTKAAACGALARTYISMRDYKNAHYYAGLGLKKYGILMDYNNIPDANAPFRHFNAETILYNSCTSFAVVLYTSWGRIDTVLYRSYDNNDLRKARFFRSNTGADAGSYRFKGAYNGDYFAGCVFDGITTGEMYLIRAECAAREGDVDNAITDLNTLMKKRWAVNKFVPFTTTSKETALNYILTERRKELIYRGVRWSDLRRFNIEGANITLTRVINNVTYTLPPNDPRWVLLIPKEVINRTGIEQNKR